MAKARAEPAGEQRRVRARALDRQPLDRSDARPARREPTPATGACGARRCRTPPSAVNRCASWPYAARDRRPLRRVDDEPVADVDDLRERRRVPVRLAAPAAERGQVGDEQRQHDGRGVVRRLAAETQLDHLGEHLAAAGELEVADRRVRLDAAAAAGERHEDDRPRRVTLGETREHALRARRPTRAAPRRGGSSCSSGARARRRPPRGSASARASARSRRRRPSVPPQCLRHERPSRCTSSSERAGPQLPAA